MEPPAALRTVPALERVCSGSKGPSAAAVGSSGSSGPTPTHTPPEGGSFCCSLLFASGFGP